MRDTFRYFVLVILLLFVSALGNVTLAQTTSSNGSVSDQAKPVLDRAVQFLGGIDNIRALKDMEGRMQQTMISPKGNVEIQIHSIIVYPGTCRQEYKASFGKKSTSTEAFFDGTNGWIVQDGKLTDINEDQKRGTRQEISQELPNLLGLVGGPTVTYEGKSGGNDVLLFVLGDLSVRLHIDSTGQVVKLARHRPSGDIEVTFSDYRKVGGVEMAYKMWVIRNGQRYSDTQITEARANTNPSLDKLAEKPAGSQQTAPCEHDLKAQYPKGRVLNLLSTDIVGTIDCKGGHPWSTFKDGKLHAPGFGQNIMFSTMKCATQPIAQGTQLYLSDMQVDQKHSQVIFAVTQCSVADCPSGVEGAVFSQVNFEFPKGFLDTAQFAQVQEAIGRVFSIASTPNAPAQGSEIAQAVSEPALPPQPPVTPLKLPALYVSARAPADQLHLNGDNSFSLQESGEPYHGTFVANGNTLELSISETSTKTTLSRLGTDLTDSSGQTWRLRQ